jgi:hypothetical protein
MKTLRKDYRVPCWSMRAAWRRSSNAVAARGGKLATACRASRRRCALLDESGLLQAIAKGRENFSLSDLRRGAEVAHDGLLLRS